MRLQRDEQATVTWRGRVAVCVATILLACSAYAAEMKSRPGAAAPSLALKDLQGTSRALDQYRGKVVIVNFWATWCEPCIEEMPSLEKLMSRLPRDSATVLAVNLGEREVRIKSFVQKTGITFPVLLDRDGVAKKAWKVGGVPATFVLDAKGKVRYSHVGSLDFGDANIEAQIVRLLPNRKDNNKK